MTFDVDQFLDEYEAPTVTVRVCTHAGLVEEHRRLERELVESRPTGSLADEPPRDKAERITDLEAQIAASSKSFRFQALSRRRWRALLAAHPPGKEHQGLDFHPETFPPAAIAACAVEPTIRPEQADRLADRLPLSEFEKLWGAVLEANLSVVDTPKSVIATAVLAMNGASSTTAAPGVSPEASS